MSSDTLTINGLAVRCRLGITPQEQETPQDVRIDLALQIDAAAAARRDDVHDTVDYASLAAAVKQLVEGKPYRLMETMAEDVARVALKGFPSPAIEVKITKRALPGIAAATIHITRKK